MLTPRTDPIPSLKRDAALQVVRSVDGMSLEYAAAFLRTGRSRIAELRSGDLTRFSLETLLRFCARANYSVELRITRR